MLDRTVFPCATPANNLNDCRAQKTVIAPTRGDSELAAGAILVQLQPGGVVDVCCEPRKTLGFLMGGTELESVTSTMSTLRSNQLS